MQTEKGLQTYLKREALKIGASFDKLESRTRRGFPDCLIIYKGRCVFVELKSPAGTGQLTPLQKHVIDDLSSHGARVFVLNSADLVDDLIDLLKEY